jgi:hypothetical protein
MPEYFTKPVEREEIVDGEFEAIDAERVQIDRLLKANADELAKVQAPPSMAVRGPAGTQIQTLRASPRRELLLREQWRLVQRRNKIYERWAVLKKANA